MPTVVEVECLAGLGPVVRHEIDELVGAAARFASEAPTAIEVEVDDAGVARRLLGLRTAVAVYVVGRYDVPRPRGLLGDAMFRRLTAQVAATIDWQPPGAFKSLRLDAAGRASSVMRRLADALASATGLTYAPNDGELEVRIRPSRTIGGWDVLTRTSARPLSARRWRRRDYRGALNATIAAAMLRLVADDADKTLVNLACGSGTLMAEHHEMGGTASIGVDNDKGVLDLARVNAPHAALVSADATCLPWPDEWCAALVADLPYGQASGSHQDNEVLYPALLAEAARVARASARLVVITHDIRRFRAALDGSAWSVARELQVFQKGHHPVIWLLTREPPGKA